jgi:glycosidase
MHVLLDWVGNHTAWDNPWATEHPEWYKKDAKGAIHSVTFKNEAGGTEEWTDVIGLDFNNRALWDGMTDAMAYWVREADIDGFRCDAAGLVPTAYWDSARAALDKIKPMFMLAEWETADLHARAFDMSYAWNLKDVFRKIGSGKGGAQDLRDYVNKPAKVFPRDAYRMLFTNNHDINSWDGTDRQLYGAAYPALAVLSFTLPGMPLIYDGQEAGLDKKLAFFEKDPIDFSHLPRAQFYTDLIALKKANPALWNGQYGGDITVLDAGNKAVFAFRRALAGNTVDVAVNLSKRAQRYTLPGHKAATLAAWQWQIDAKGH